jgi:hypothetical protein
MSVRKLLPIVLLLAAVSIRCSGSPNEPDGMVLVTQTTTTTTSTSTTTTATTTIPGVGGGAVSASPSGTGLASATVFTFRSSPPSGGLPPFTIAWNFGDGEEGAGALATHVYANTGTFTAVATATDSRGMSAQSSTTVSVREVTGSWAVTFAASTGLQPQPMDLIQVQKSVTATINDTANSLGFASGTGSVSNPRSLAISATFRAGTPLAFAATYVGTIDATLSVWTGTVTGYPGCPCPFTATRHSFPGDFLPRR